MTQLTITDAYLAMFAFLEAEYQLTKSDELGVLLGSMSLLSNGVPADPAVKTQWEIAVIAAKSGEVDASFRMER